MSEQAQDTHTDIADYPPDKLLSQEELAEALGVCVRSVRNMVARGELPAPFELCGKKFRVGTVLEHIQRRAKEAAEVAARKTPSVDDLGVSRRRRRTAL